MTVSTRVQTGRSLRRDWRGTWGPSRDGRSKFARLVRERVRDLVADYLGVAVPGSTPGHTVPARALDAALAKAPGRVARAIRKAALFDCLADQQLAELGSDPKATARNATVAQKRADAKLALVERLTAQHRNGRGAGSPAEDLMQALRRAPVLSPSEGEPC